MPIAAVVDKIIAFGADPPHPVVVLDLDSTLIDTGPRHLAILEAFGSAHDIDVSDVLAYYACRPVGWAVDPGLQACGWPEQRVSAFHAFWAERFFDGAWCRFDQATPGAVALARAVIQSGGIACYLTARPSPTMGIGTVTSLTALGFPLFRARAPLHMKPSPHLSDARFKRAARQEVAALGTVVATFDNEPAHVNAMQEAFPDAAHFLVGDVCSPDAPAPSPGIVALPDLHRRG